MTDTEKPNETPEWPSASKAMLSADNDLLAYWWCELNSWRWPSDLGPVNEMRRTAIMQDIVRRIGIRRCLEKWNSEMDRRIGRADNKD